MILIIFESKRRNINPDNVATPIAAILGDVVTLALLAYVGTVFYDHSLFMIYISFFLLLSQS